MLTSDGLKGNLEALSRQNVGGVFENEDSESPFSKTWKRHNLREVCNNFVYFT